VTVVWVVSGLSAVLVMVSVRLLWNDLRGAPRSWQLLASSGLPLAVGGLGFILRFWQPLPGPYRVNDAYPLGPYLNTWAVSFGFMWLAFGLVFFALALRTPRTGQSWLVLFAAWVLAWIPHGIVGIGFAWAGSNRPNVELYRSWASGWPGLIVLGTSALILLAHFGLALWGFVRTGLEIRRTAFAHPTVTGVR
jgi:hypothetical protein